MANKKNHIKKISSLVSACIVSFIAGSLYSISSTIQYYASYLLYNGYPNITVKDCLFFMPIVGFFQFLFSSLGGFMEGKYGARLPTAIGMLLFATGYLIFYLIFNLYVIYFCMMIIGTGIGLCYLAVLRNSWRHFPKNKGLVSGIILAFFGLSSSAYVNVAEFIINPDKIPTMSNNLYEESVANRVPTYILVIIISSLSLSLVSLLILFPPEQTKNDTQNSFLKNENEISPSQTDSEEIKTREDKEPLKLALCSRQFAIISIMAFFYVFYPFMMANLSRPFGTLTLTQNEITVLVTILPISNGICRVIWGFLGDIIRFKYLYSFTIIFGICISSTIGFVSETAWVYFIFCLFSGSMIGANQTLLPILINKIFGLKNSAELYGIICFFVGLSGFSGPFLTKALIKDTVKEDYLIIFWIGTSFLIVALVLCIILKDTKFDYDAKAKEVKGISLNDTIKIV